MQPLSMPSPHLLVVDTSVWATSQLTTAVKCIFCVFVFSSQLCCPLRFQKSPQTCLWEGFPLWGNFTSFTIPSLGWVSVPKFMSLVLSFIFCCTSFWRDWAVFLGAWYLQQHSEAVLWKLINIQMTFWWICDGESALLILFLCHLRVWLFKTPWTTACKASLSFTISQSLLKLTSIKSVMPFNHLVFCHPLLLMPSVFPRIRVFSRVSSSH